jgi:succinylglutamate desuccinylase
MKIFEQLGHLRNRWVLCQHLKIRAAVPKIFNQLSNQLCELPTELVKYLKNCHSDHLMLAKDPPVPEMI